MIKFSDYIQEAMAVSDVNTEPGDTDVAVIMGRFQPPTKAHLKIIENAYKKTHNKVAVFIVKSKSEKSPFDTGRVIDILKTLKVPIEIFVIKNGFIGEFVHILRNNKLEPTTLWVGSDRKSSYESQIRRYEDTFNLNLEVKEIKRSAEDISASKVREALLNDDFETFKSMMTKNSLKFYEKLKKDLKMKSFTEEFLKLTEENEENVIDDNNELEDRLIDFVLDIDEEQLSEDLQERYYELIEDLEDEGIDTDDDDDDLDEGVRRKKIKASDRLKRKKAYKRNKNKIKRKSKKFRKTAGYKKYKKKSKRMNKRGRTASGKRKTKFI